MVAGPNYGLSCSVVEVHCLDPLYPALVFVKLPNLITSILCIYIYVLAYTHQIRYKTRLGYRGLASV